MLTMATGEAFDTVLAAAQAGGEWAFAALYKEFNPRLERYFAAKAPAVREDLASETWIGVARVLHEFRGDEKQFRSLLFTIAHRRLVDHWRQVASKPDLLEPGAMTTWVGGDDTEETVVDAVSAQDAARRIAQSLSPEQADVVLLRVLGDLDVEQVAEILGKRPGAVRALQHRALQRLKKENFLEAVTQ